MKRVGLKGTTKSCVYIYNLLVSIAGWLKDSQEKGLKFTHADLTVQVHKKVNLRTIDLATAVEDLTNSKKKCHHQKQFRWKCTLLWLINEAMKLGR